jgi:hypothetical protein
MSFADGVVRLARIGARIESGPVADPAADAAPRHGSRRRRGLAPARATGERPGRPVETAQFAAEAVVSPDLMAIAAATPAAIELVQPGLADLEAAVQLVSAGIATRVVLSGFPSWPGLLWKAYQMAEHSDVVILPTVVRSGGFVDIVVARTESPNV